MLHELIGSKAEQPAATYLLRRHARYLLGDAACGDQMAKEIIRLSAGILPLGPGGEPWQVALLRLMHHEFPDMSDDPRRHSFGAWSLRVLEHCSQKQVESILPNLTPEREYLRPPRGLRVLLIEDEALLAMDVCQAATDLGNSIVGVARTQAEALHQVKSTAPDLIICDVALADGSSGTATIATISDKLHPLPVVFLTAGPENLFQGKRAEPPYVLGKPHENAELECMIALAFRTPEELPSRPTTYSDTC